MLKLNDYIKQFLSTTSQYAIVQGDILEIIPIRGRKKTIKMNRAIYQIILCPDLLEIKIEGQKIYVPSSLHNTGTLILKLYQGGPYSTYFLESEHEGHFIYNGRVSNFGFIREGDLVNLDLNLLKFKKEETDSKGKKFIDELVDNNAYIKSENSILLTGETGTGKTTLAKEIHERSGKTGNFVHLNLSSFSNNLIESEIFGHRKGAFTGATYEKMGAIQEAKNGSLFLDEIDSISIELQTKLLTFLDNGEYRSVGGGVKKAQVRMIFSTGKNLRSLVLNEKMRLDFYYRIKDSMQINIPSLREDPAYLKRMIYEILNENFCSISPKLLRWYLECPWYGNIRQLKSHLKRKMFDFKNGHICFSKVDLSLKNEGFPIGNILESQDILKLSDLKQAYIKQMLIINDGNIKKTSGQLGVSENTLRRCV